jgi:hypothetical protein
MSKAGDPLGDYFNNIADLLEASAQAASTQDHAGDKGTNRELVLIDFLKKHLPRRLRAFQGGEIFGTGEKRSSQMDIIIAHDVCLSFLQNGRSQFPVEGVASIISVKSTLTDLQSELDAFDTIPALDLSVFNLMLAPKGLDEYMKNFPYYFVFGFQGMSYAHCKKLLHERYDQSDSSVRLPSAIIVNRKYLIACSRDPSGKFQTRGGEVTPEHWNLRGWPLLWLNGQISKITAWLNYMQLDMAPYLKKAYPSGVFE